MRLRAIRGRLQHVAGDKWQRMIGADCDVIETRRAVDDIGHGAADTLLTLSPTCDPAEAMLIGEARADLEFLVAMLDQAFAEIRRLKRSQPADPPARDARPKDHAAEAAMKCADPLFQKFLGERARAEPCQDPDRAAVLLRQVLDIKSRSEINTDTFTARRWRDLRAEFEAWGRG